jgi:hypothetical protein
LIVIHSIDEIPLFATEREESDFWATHDLSEELMASAEPIPEGDLPPPRERTRPITLRLEGDTLRRLRSLAARRGMRYQTLLKEFVVERLYEEEKRDGIIGSAAAPGMRRPATGKK